MPCGGQRSKSKAPVGTGRSASSMRPCSSKVIFEISVGPAAAARRPRDGVVAERAIGAEPDRPDLQAGGDRVKEAMLVDGEAEEARSGGA